MEYKPPVKSSVKKLYGGRRRQQRLPSQKGAVAGALTVPPLEQRLRDLVFFSKQEKARNNSKNAVVVQTIESLQEYKTVVADETEKIVAVRFYAPWCKVRTVRSNVL